jgi:hypothetical protein
MNERMVQMLVWEIVSSTSMRLNFGFLGAMWLVAGRDDLSEPLD